MHKKACASAHSGGIILLAAVAGIFSACVAWALEPTFQTEDELNLYCLKLAYPQIRTVESTPQGISLVLQNGRRLPYSAAGPFPDPLAADIKTSMDQPYPLEPERPETAWGVAPGRKRPYALFEALYGRDKIEVSRRLQPAALFGKKISLSPDAAAAIGKAAGALEKASALNPALRSWLQVNGGFYWRKIAGENVLSAHSYGIAVDLSGNKAPYWRWARKMPHPLQFSYPSEIVRVMEDHGFIWGGKWHEYDLMHFEYRPELICKARMLSGADSQRHKPTSKFSSKRE